MELHYTGPCEQFEQLIGGREHPDARRTMHGEVEALNHMEGWSCCAGRPRYTSNKAMPRSGSAIRWWARVSAEGTSRDWTPQALPFDGARIRCEHPVIPIARAVNSSRFLRTAQGILIL